MTKYCQSCGSPTEYTLNSPKFCSSCGNPFGGQTSTASVKLAPRPPSTSFPTNERLSQLAKLKLLKRDKIEPDIEIDKEDDDFGPTELNLDNLSDENTGFEEEGIPTKRNSGIRISQIAGSSKEPIKPIQAPKGKYNKKAQLNEWKKEASSGPPPKRQRAED